MIRSVVFNLSLKIARIIAIACHISHSLRSWRHNTGKANKYLLGSDISWDHVNVCRNMLQNILFIALLEFVFLDMNTKKVCIKCICQWKRCQKVESFYEWMDVDQVRSTKRSRVYISPPWSWGGGGSSPMHKLYGHIPLGILWFLTSLISYRGTEGNQGVLV